MHIILELYNSHIASLILIMTATVKRSCTAQLVYNFANSLLILLPFDYPTVKWCIGVL